MSSRGDVGWEDLVLHPRISSLFSLVSLSPCANLPLFLQNKCGANFARPHMYNSLIRKC